MRVLSHDDVIRHLSMEACMDVVEQALRELALGKSQQVLRSVLPLENNRAYAMMPAILEHTVGLKTITVFPDNHSKGLPSHQGLVAIFDRVNGQVQSVMDAQSITAIRTAAASGVATKRLAREDAQVLAMIGTGEQARTHLEAMLVARPIREVRVWGPNRDHSEVYRQDMMKQFGDKYEVDLHIADTAEDAVRDADILCTVTAATEPVVFGDWVADGTHINAVGACRATDRELDAKTVRKSRFYADRTESVEAEAGDYLLAVKEGAIKSGHLLGEIGDLLLGRVRGRISGADVTVFESLGIAVQDLAVAAYLAQEATTQGFGTEVSF